MTTLPTLVLVVMQVQDSETSTYQAAYTLAVLVRLISSMIMRRGRLLLLYKAAQEIQQLPMQNNQVVTLKLVV